MAYKERDTVVLVRDIPEHSLRAGDLGAVVHVHSANNCEVEFVRASGQTQAVVMLDLTDLRAVQAGDLIAVRRLDQPVPEAT